MVVDRDRHGVLVFVLLIVIQERELEKVNAFYLQKEAEVYQKKILFEYKKSSFILTREL